MVEIVHQRRVDVSRLERFARTGAGAVRIPATIARTGVQLYPGKGKDGATIREYRPADEVFAPESLASLGSVPVTLGHPRDGVHPGNARDVQIGHVSDAPPEPRVRLDGSTEEWIRTVMVVSDGAVLSEIDSSGADESWEVSCGYDCDLEMTAGVTPDGQPFDAIQRNIRFNHVGLDSTRRWKARAGADAKLRLDSQGNPMKIIVIDGVEYEQGSDKHVAKLNSDVASATARADKAEAERDTQKERADKAESAIAPAALDARVEARMALLQRASKFLPGDYNTAGKSDAQVRADAVSAKIGADKIAGKSEAYIEARFDGLCDASGDAQYHNPGTKRADGAARPGSAPSINDSDEAFRAALAKKSGGEEE